MRDDKTDGLIIKFFKVSEVNLSISSKRGAKYRYFRTKSLNCCTLTTFFFYKLEGEPWPPLVHM